MEFTINLPFIVKNINKLSAYWSVDIKIKKNKQKKIK